MTTEFWFWGGFTLFILALIARNPGGFQRRPHGISPNGAGLWLRKHCLRVNPGVMETQLVLMKEGN
jgi:hypothetical protein